MKAYRIFNAVTDETLEIMNTSRKMAEETLEEYLDWCAADIEILDS